MKSRSLRFPFLLFLLLLFWFSCKPGENVAPGGAHLFLTADPSEIAFNEVEFLMDDVLGKLIVIK